MRSTTGHTFGGYASAPWTSAARSYTNAAGCFLFLVENPHNDAPTCFECSNVQAAMYCGSNKGPSFGGGHDLCLYDGVDTARSYTNFPHSYTDTLGRASATFTRLNRSLRSHAHGRPTVQPSPVQRLTAADRRSPHLRLRELGSRRHALLPKTKRALVRVPSSDKLSGLLRGEWPQEGSRGGIAMANQLDSTRARVRPAHALPPPRSRASLRPLACICHLRVQ